MELGLTLWVFSGSTTGLGETCCQKGVGAMNDLEKLFLSGLKDIYDGEHQLIEALSEMERTTQSGELKTAFQDHLEQTKMHIDRLEQVFEQFDETPKRRTCHGIEGIISEGQSGVRDFADSSALDSALLANAQKAEHFEISSYGSLCTWAKELSHDGALRLLKENLSEEKQTDGHLKRLAQMRRIPGRQRDLPRLFLSQLREMYDAEHMLACALPELELYATSKLLKFAVHHHMRQTEKHSKRLEKVFKEVGLAPDRKACKGIEGIIDDAQVIVEEFLGNSALDAGLIAAGQKAEHYEIATYTALRVWAEILGYKQAVSEIDDNLSDEEETDKALTLLARTSLNREAAQGDSPKKSDEEAALAKAITHGP
jgi:ferritin-like metal-binding protein YciE